MSEPPRDLVQVGCLIEAQERRIERIEAALRRLSYEGKEWQSVEEQRRSAVSLDDLLTASTKHQEQFCAKPKMQSSSVQSQEVNEFPQMLEQQFTSALQRMELSIEKRFLNLEDDLQSIKHVQGQTRSSKEIDIDVEQQHDAYVFKESVWDAVVVQWFSTHMCDCVVMALVYFLNLGAQLLLLYVIYLNFSLDEWLDESDLHEILRWRLGISQHMRHFDASSNTTLATRVCESDATNIAAFYQAEAFSALESYMFLNRPFNGPLLIICSLLIWIMSILSEIQQVFYFGLALLSLDGSGSTVGKWRESGDGSIFSITHVRCAWRLSMLATIVAPRLLISIWLGLSGVMYLANINHLGDMILNVMALGFVLDLDELMYIFVPTRTSYTLSSTESIPLKAERVHAVGKHIDVNRLFSMCMLFLAFPLLIVVYATVLQPLFHNVEIAHALMCGGKVNLVFGQGNTNNIMSYAVAAETTWGTQADWTTEYDYAASSILQTIGLQNMPQLQGMFAELPLPQVLLAQHVSLEKMQSFQRQTKEEAILQQICLNVDYDDPARAALQDATGMKWCNMTDAYNLSGRCAEPVVRRFCPQTCSCDNVSWWYDRSGCPPACTEAYEVNLNRYVLEKQLIHNGCDEEIQIHDGLPYMGGNLASFSSFVQQEISENGKLNEDGHPSRPMQDRVKWFSGNECLFTNGPFSLDAMIAAAVDVEDECNVLTFVNAIFDTKLCDYSWRFAHGLGNIAAFCPSVCHMCGSQASDHQQVHLQDTVMGEDWMQEFSVLEYFHSSVKCGYEWIFCGQSLNGSTSGDDVSYKGGLAREKIYAFWGEKGRKYSFRAVSFSTKRTYFGTSYEIKFGLSIYDSIWSETALYSSMARILSPQELLALNNVTFNKTARYLIIVEPLAVTQGDFQLQMSSDDHNCGLAVPERIQCNDVLNRSTKNKLNVLQGPSPESIFRFTADIGVEYVFESCSSSLDTHLFLYDDYLRDPPNIEGTLSTSNCPHEGSHEVIRARFDMPGDYHIVAEGSGGWSLWGLSFGTTGYIQLSMRCIS